MEPAILQKRLDREKKARFQAEKLLEEKSRELYNSNQSLLAATHGLAAQSKELAAILDNTRSGIFLVNENGIIKRANHSATEMFARTEDEFAQLPAINLLKNDEQKEFLSALTNTTQADFRKDTMAVRTDDSTFPVEVCIAPAEIDAHRYNVWICRDLTIHRQQEEERLRLEQELLQSQKLESLGVLASGIAHEINTPVQYVTDNVKFFNTSAIELTRAFNAYKILCIRLNEGKDATEELNAALQIEKTADLDFVFKELPDALHHSIEGLAQIAKIVGAVKTFSHPGSVTKSPTDINTLLEDTIIVSKNQWKFIAEVKTNFDTALPVVPGLPRELSQVFLNLIVNAVHAIESHGVPGIITISTRMEGDQVEISISDNGCGISTANKSKVFDPFFTTKDIGKGTGQGLSLCYTIITKKHHGTISLSSTEGQGAKFTISLPTN